MLNKFCTRGTKSFKQLIVVYLLTKVLCKISSKLSKITFYTGHSTLEENEVLGEGLEFTNNEKSIATSTPTVINYITNFYQSASDIQIQQGTDASEQSKKELATENVVSSFLVNQSIF